MWNCPHYDGLKLKLKKKKLHDAETSHYDGLKITEI